MVDFTKQGREEPPRMMVLIQSVDVAARTASGVETKNNSIVNGIDLSASHARMIDWPRVGEHWACTKVSESWFLDYKLAYGNDAFQYDAAPGDSVLATDGVVLLKGSSVRLVDDLEADILGSLRDQASSMRDQTAALRTALFGAPNRTRAPYVEIQMKTDYALPSADALIPAANWYTPVDTDGGWLGQTYRVPITGLYRAQFTAVLVSPNTGPFVAWLSKNGGVGASGAVYLQQTNLFMGIANTQVMPEPNFTGQFNAGDVVYFGCRGQANTTINAAIGQSHTRFTMTWIGPA